MGLRWRVLSGVGERHGSAYWVQSGADCWLLDAGCEVSDLPCRPTAIVLSHAHWDHISGLVPMVERFPCVKLFGTAHTRSYLKNVLTARLSYERASAISDSVVTQKFHEKISGVNSSVELLAAGHVPGAAMIRVHADSMLTYTGDFSAHEVPGAGSADFGHTRGGTLIMECSLGALRQLDEWRLEDVSFPESGLFLGGAIGECGVAMKLGAFAVHENLRDFVKAETVSTARALQVLRAGGRVLAAGKELSSGTASWELAAALIEDRAAKVVFLNPPGRGTNGELLLKSGTRSRLKPFGNSRKRCHVQAVSMPLHTPFPGLLSTIRGCRPDTLALVHNHRGALHGLARRFAHEGVSAFVPQLGEDYDAVKAG